jgi:hypothetical protein
VRKGLLHPLIGNTTNGQSGLSRLSGVAGVVKKHQHELDLKGDDQILRIEKVEVNGDG